MKESKLLKIISYLMIPIIVAILILSILSNYVSNYITQEVKEENYFSTDRFVENYMNVLSIFSNILIYQNENYPIGYDGDVQITYIENTSINNQIPYEKCYILIKYKNKALTNVELTSDTNTVQKILDFIEQNENAKKVKIIAGNIDSDSELIKKKGIKYFRTISTYLLHD